MIDNILSCVIGLTYSIYFVRTITVLEYGQWSFAQSFLALIMMFAHLGLPSITVRDVSRDIRLTEKYISLQICLKSISAIIIYAIIFAYFTAKSYDNIVIYLVLILSLSSVIDTILINSLRPVFQAHQKFSFEVIPSIVSKILNVGISIMLLFLGYRLIALAAVVVLSTLFHYSLSMYALRRLGYRLKLAFDMPEARKLIAASAPFALAFLVGDFLLRIDVVMLSILKGEESVAYYNIATKFPYYFFFMGSAIASPFYPVLSKSYRVDPAEFQNRLFQLIQFLLFAGICVTLFFFVFAKETVTLLYSDRYLPSVPALKIVILFYPFWMFRYSCALALRSSDRPHVDFYIVASSLFLNILLNLYLISKYNFIGAAIATVLCEVFICILSYVYLYRKKIVPDVNFRLLILTGTTILFFASIDSLVERFHFFCVLPTLIYFAVVIYVLKLIVPFKAFLGTYVFKSERRSPDG